MSDTIKGASRTATYRKRLAKKKSNEARSVGGCHRGRKAKSPYSGGRRGAKELGRHNEIPARASPYRRQGGQSTGGGFPRAPRRKS